MELMKKVKAKEPGLTSITLNSCLQFLVGQSQNAQHDALQDTLDLQKICEEACKKVGLQSADEFFQKPSMIKSLNLLR